MSPTAWQQEVQAIVDTTARKDPSDPELFAATLVAAMRALRLTRVGLAAELGVTERTIRRWISAATPPEPSRRWTVWAWLQFKALETLGAAVTVPDAKQKRVPYGKGAPRSWRPAKGRSTWSRKGCGRRKRRSSKPVRGTGGKKGL